MIGRLDRFTGHFFVKSRGKGLPFYQILKRPTNFQLMKEASVAF